MIKNPVAKIVGFQGFKNQENVFKNVHFWIILVIFIFLILLYQSWPWREMQLSETWQRFSWLTFFQSIADFEFLNHLVGILFLVPILYAAVVFSWRGALFSWLLAVAGVLPLTLRLWNIGTVFIDLLWLLLPFLGASIISMELKWRSKEKAIFAERELERHLYISQLMKAQENERQRIAP